MKKKGIETETTALTLHGNTALSERKAGGKIDKIVRGHAELFVPKKPFDVIISVFGSTTYTHPSARKEQLLKFAQSLGRGGIMLVCFGIASAEKPGFVGLSKKAQGKAAITGFKNRTGTLYGET